MLLFVHPLCLLLKFSYNVKRGELRRPSQRPVPTSLTPQDFQEEHFDPIKMYLYVNSVLEVAIATDQKLNVLSAIQQRHLKETTGEQIQSLISLIYKIQI